MTATNYISDQVQRTLAVAAALAGNEFGGMAVSEVAQATRMRSDQAFRALANLVEAGWAEQLPSGRYRLGPKPVQVAVAFSTALSRAETELAGVRQRYTRQP